MAEPYVHLLARRTSLGGAEESTAGTLPTITTALASTMVLSAEIEETDLFAQGQRTPAGKFGGGVTAVPGQLLGRGQFSTQIHASDKTLPMLTMCGFALSTGTYAPTSDMSSRKTWGFKLFEDGRYKTLAGCAADLTLDIPVGGPASAMFDATGIWAAPGDAAIVAPSDPSALPYICRSMTATLAAAVMPFWSRATIRLNNSIGITPDATLASGARYAYVIDRRVTVEFDFAARKVGDVDQYGIMAAATEVALSLVLTAGAKTLTIACPKLQRIAIGNSVRDGIRVDTVTFQANRSAPTAGDDEITFTEV